MRDNTRENEHRERVVRDTVSFSRPVPDEPKIVKPVPTAARVETKKGDEGNIV